MKLDAAAAAVGVAVAAAPTSAVDPAAVFLVAGWPRVVSLVPECALAAHVIAAAIGIVPAIGTVRGTGIVPAIGRAAIIGVVKTGTATSGMVIIITAMM